MWLYAISLFLHIMSALALATLLGLEWVGLIGLRRSTMVKQARTWSGLLGLRRPGAFALLTLLLTGIRLGFTGWGAPAWLLAGLVAMAAIAFLGALGARRVALIRRVLAAAPGEISRPIARRLHDPAFDFSIRLRTALFLGVVCVMVDKPGTAGALVAIGVSAMVGLIVGPTHRTPEVPLPRASR
jgi:hypothetical protein